TTFFGKRCWFRFEVVDRHPEFVGLAPGTADVEGMVRVQLTIGVVLVGIGIDLVAVVLFATCSIRYFTEGNTAVESAAANEQLLGAIAANLTFDSDGVTDFDRLLEPVERTQRCDASCLQFPALRLAVGGDLDAVARMRVGITHFTYHACQFRASAAVEFSFEGMMCQRGGCAMQGECDPCRKHGEFE